MFEAKLQQWTRLIRFVAVETSQVHIGQPVDLNLDVGLAFHQKQPIKVFEISGSALDPSAQVTTQVLTVQSLLSPLARQEIKVVRCLGLNYADHAVEANLPIPIAPILFFKPVTALIGPSAQIIVPKVAQPVEKHFPDYEVELIVIIGKPAKNVPEAQALDYILAYTCGNDVSFRYHQMTISQWDYSKGFDNTTPIGPCLVAANAIKDPQNLRLTCMLNGQVVQDVLPSDQIFSIRKTISTLSQGTTLEPGSIIMTGTPKGVGFTRKPSVYMKQGDLLCSFIGGGVGTLVNQVVEEGSSVKL